MNPLLKTFFNTTIDSYAETFQAIVDAHRESVALYHDLRSAPDKEYNEMHVTQASVANAALVSHARAIASDLQNVMAVHLAYSLEETAPQANARDETTTINDKADPEPIRVPTPPPVDNSDLYDDLCRRPPPAQPVAVMVPLQTPAGGDESAPAPVAGTSQQSKSPADHAEDESASSAPALVVDQSEQPKPKSPPHNVVDEQLEDVMSTGSDSSTADESLRIIAEGSFLQCANTICIVLIIAADTGNFIRDFHSQAEALLQDGNRLVDIIQQQRWMTGNALERLVQMTVGLSLSYSIGGHSTIRSGRLQAVAQRFSRQVLDQVQSLQCPISQASWRLTGRR